AAFVVQYAGIAGHGANAAADATLTMWPPKLGLSGLLGRAWTRSCICRPNRREPWTTPIRLTPMILSQVSGPVSRNGPATAMPALLTRMSGARWGSLISAADGSLACASDTSTRWAAPPGPPALPRAPAG